MDSKLRSLDLWGLFLYFKTLRICYYSQILTVNFRINWQNSKINIHLAI